MRLHALQYLRAVAALAVVYSHSVQQVPQYQALLAHKGAFGVDIFFVISGFIMVYISKPTDTPTSFLANRIRRVVPLYWFFTLLMAAILLVLPGLFKASSFDLAAVLKSLLFIPHYSIAYPEQIWPIVAPGWSLNYEMYFYLLFALSLLLTPRWRLAAVCSVIVVILLIANQLQGNSAMLRFLQESVVLEFVMGMLLAKVFRHGLRVPQPLAWSTLVLGFALIIPEFDIPPLLDTSIPALMIVFAALYIKVPEWKWMVLQGDASYSLYLSHIFTLGLCRKLIPPFLGDGFLSALVFVISCLLICSAVGVVVHRLIDNQLLRVKSWQRLLPVRG